MGVFPSFAAAAAPEQFVIFTSLFPDGPPSEAIATYVTTDGINFTTPDGVTNPVGTYEMNGGNDGTVDTEAMDAMYYPGATYNYWVCYEQVGGYPYQGFSQSTLGISGSVTKDGPFVWVADVEIYPSVDPVQTVWDPRWFIDDNGDVYVIANCCTGRPSVGYGLLPKITKCNNPGTFSSWGSSVDITGTGFPDNEFDGMLDATIISPNNSPDGKYNMFIKQAFGTTFIERWHSDSLTSGYILVSTDMFGFGACENFHFYQWNPTTWRAYASQNGAAPTTMVEGPNDWSSWSDPVECSAEGHTDFRVVAYAGIGPNSLSP